MRGIKNSSQYYDKGKNRTTNALGRISPGIERSDRQFL